MPRAKPPIPMSCATAKSSSTYFSKRPKSCASITSRLGTTRGWITTDLTRFCRKPWTNLKINPISCGQSNRGNSVAAFFTIGQRHGLAIGGRVPYYVAEKKLDANALIVGEGADDPVLFKSAIRVHQLNWLSDFRGGGCDVRIRYPPPRG